MSGRRRIWLAVSAAIGVALLLALGTWQVQRMQWKDDLISERRRMLAQKPVALSELIATEKAGERIELKPVTVTGVFAPEARYVFNSRDGEPGWQVVSPLVTADGKVVLVDRGFVPDSFRAAPERTPPPPVVETTVSGYASRHPEGAGPFTPDNDVAGNKWFWWSIPALMDSLQAKSKGEPLDFVVHALPAGATDAYPRPTPPSVNLPNNHLQYALTWYALAVVLALMVNLVLRRPPGAAPPPPAPPAGGTP